MAGRRFGPGAVRPEQSDLGLVFCARGVDGRTELFDLLVIRCVLLAIERRWAGWTKLRAVVHREWPNKSPLRQQIGKERRRSRNPHARTAAARWLDNRIMSIVISHGENHGRHEFAPDDACSLVRPIRDRSKNRRV